MGCSLAFKGFSLTPTTRRVYRSAGNTFETWRRRREGFPERYLRRTRWLIDCAHNDVGASPSTVLEVGTGFVHWESLTMSLLGEVQATMIDIVNNRLFPILPLYARGLVRYIDEIGLTEVERGHAKKVLTIVSNATSAEDLYHELGWRYVLDPTGCLGPLDSEHYDLVVSSDVLEHIGRDGMDAFLARMHDVMRPGAHACHIVGMRDHLSNFDPKAPAKLYYRYSSDGWERWFNSRLQYINRIQRAEWPPLFRAAGFDVVVDRVLASEPHGVRHVHPDYDWVPEEDRDANTYLIVARKPG